MNRGVIPVVSWCGLVVPAVLAGVCIKRHDRGEIQVIAAAGRTQFSGPGGTITNAEVDGIEVRVIDNRVPYCSTTAIFPVVGSFPAFRCSLHGFVFKRFSRIARNGVKPPNLITGLRVVGSDVASHTKFGATVADEDLVVGYPWCACDGIEAVTVDDGVNAPDLFAGFRV